MLTDKKCYECGAKIGRGRPHKQNCKSLNQTVDLEAIVAQPEIIPPTRDKPLGLSTLKGKNVDVHLWTDINTVESTALDQLRNIAALPWCFHHVAVMPDVHYGKGATVGSVVAMKNAVSPAAVGVDLSCGMLAAKTNISAHDLPYSLVELRSKIEEVIPVGFSEHKEPDKTKNQRTINLANRLFKEEFSNLHPKVQDLFSKATKQVGTLGGGNHFIELCLDTKNKVWIMLHSGSRNIGKTLAEIHIAIARKLIHNQSLPDKDLAVFLSGTPEMEAYRRDLYWAQDYAILNRMTMLDLLKEVLIDFFPLVEFQDPILCHHNYISEETHFGEKVFVTRKGAIKAGLGDFGIIPGSMGSKSYIVKGLGNPDSYQSASHGAGRKMSRSKANQKFTLVDLREQTCGVECRKDRGVLDEIPGAYKDIEKVMDYQKDLVEIIEELKQVLCVKG